MKFMSKKKRRRRRLSPSHSKPVFSQFLNVNMKATTATAIAALLLLLPLCLARTSTKLQQQPHAGFGMGYDSVDAHVQASSVGTHAERREERKIRHIIAKAMQNYMNLSVDPCADFYEYACGNWWRHNSRQLKTGALGTAQQLVETHIVEQLQQLLTKPLPPPNHPKEYSISIVANIRKVRDFYNACVNVNANTAERRRFLMKIVKEHGGLRNLPNSNWQHEYHWLQMLAALRRNYGLDILIGLDVDLNLQQMRGNSIYLGEPQQTIIPTEYCSVMATRLADVRDEVYEQIQLEISANMQSWLDMDSGEADRFAGDVVRFEFELCKHMREQQTLTPPDAVNLEPTYTGRSRTGQERLRQQPQGGASQLPRMTLAELTASMGNNIDFKLFVESVLEASYTEFVYLRSQNYINHLARTAKSFNRYTISSYIIYRALTELNYPPDDHATLRERNCVQLVQRLFPKVLGDMYQQQMHNDEAKHDLELIFSEVVKAFDQQLKVEWLDETDRRAAHAKLSQYHTSMPNYQGVDLSDLQFQKSDDYWRKFETVMRYNAKQRLDRLHGADFGQQTGPLDAFEARATLEPKEQAVYVGWGLLQLPYYSYYYPRALKYALLGQRLASALLYAFDDDGWNKQPQVTNPWNELTMSGYRNATECQRAQYSNYLYNQPDEFRNATKLRELIADSSALNVAFNAYINWLDQMDHKLKLLLSKETLPDMNFSNTQLFFIYFAQTRCWTRKDEEPAPEFLPLVQHTPERWSVNGPLSNSAEFGLEFNCALGTHMNSGDKCLVF